jgi:hypothetical protein
MRHNKFILFVFLVFLLQNCEDKDKLDPLVSTHTIEIQKDLMFGNSSELQIEILDTINLEAPGNPPLVDVRDIAFSEHFFLLLDVKHGLLKFDYSGSFLRTIGKKGEGPEEYISPRAIHLDEKGKCILVADWQKRAVISYDLEGNFNSSSQRVAGHPISFHRYNDTLLVVQRTLNNGDRGKTSHILLSEIIPKTLDVKHLERPLYSYHSNYTKIHIIPRIISGVRNASLFYLPIIRGDISSHSDTDTIFRKQKDHLVPEYLLRFTGFDKKNQLCIGQIVLSDSYAFVRVIYENRSNLVVIDLENNRPLVHLRQLFGQELTEEIIPKPLKGDVYYSILRGEYGVEEKNPLIVFYRIVSQD